jgi:hypothetical protein
MIGGFLDVCTEQGTEHSVIMSREGEVLYIIYFLLLKYVVYIYIRIVCPLWSV